MMQNSRVTPSTSIRATAVLSHLPSDPFTTGEFRDLATSLHILQYPAEVEPMLMHLAFRGDILRRGPKSAMWVVA